MKILLGFILLSIPLCFLIFITAIAFKSWKEFVIVWTLVLTITGIVFLGAALVTGAL